jgi:hypothetical protein
MLMEVGQFCQRVEGNLADLIDELSAVTNRSSTNEIMAWQRSLPRLSVALSQPSLQDFHISLGQSGAISLEYRLPAASAWCDAVLLGKGEHTPSAVMIELKDWDTTGMMPATRENLIEHHGVLRSHPSDQVRGYVEYCQNFHSAVLAENAMVSGCVFFTNEKDLSILRNPPYESLVSQFPVFSNLDETASYSLSNYLARYLFQPDANFAYNFENGGYSQNRSLVQQIADLILDEYKTVFVLLDEQRRGYELCMREIDEVLSKAGQDEKAIIIIEGPPGSGKSVLAAKLWATLAKDRRISGSIVMTSTSSSQNTNWESLFKRQILNRMGGGVILKSNSYNPGLGRNWLQDVRNRGYLANVTDWRKNVRLYLEENESRMKKNSIEVSVVDEAHALIDPSVPNREGVASSGWFVQAGPQGWHIIRASRVSIFLMDSDQSYRDNETTSKSSLRAWAEELGVQHIQEISLGDAQFRCGGSKEYVEWLENVLGLSEAGNVDSSWQQRPDGSGSFMFKVVEDPEALDEALTQHLEDGKSVRLVASYGRKWVTKGISNPHDLDAGEKDFQIPYSRDGEIKYWNRIWNYAPNQKYQYYIQAPPGTKMHDNPLAEVGCPYVIRGFDYDYLGVLWLDDLVWRDNRWMVNLDSVYETAWNITLSRARKESRKGLVGPYTESVIQKLKRGYRILLSRAIQGIYVWFEDEETKKHILSELGH